MMPRSLSTTADTQAATGPAGGRAGRAGQDPAAVDGWRGGGLPALRAELDRIDDAVHDLLMHRAEIVELVARSGKPAAFRPGREASIIRRLLARHHGALPPVSIVRMWRELLAGTTAMQGGFSLAVCDTDDGAPLTQLAREHFGALTPLRAHTSTGQAMAAVSQGAASVAILPYPSDSNDWWVALLDREPRLYIIGRLPFWQPRPAGAPTAQALVVASMPPDASEADRSVLGLRYDGEAGRARVSEALSRARLEPKTMVLVNRQGSQVTNVLVEIEGYLSDDDPRFSELGASLWRPVVLGNYAVPAGGAR